MASAEIDLGDFTCSICKYERVSAKGNLPRQLVRACVRQILPVGHQEHVSFSPMTATATTAHWLFWHEIWWLSTNVRCLACNSVVDDLTIMREVGKGQRILLSTALISSLCLSSISMGEPLHDEMHSNSVIIFLGREIFENPVSLNCSHCYCKECLIGLKRSSSSASEDSDELENPEERILKQPEATPAARSSIIYTPRILEPDQSFTCAICREVSNGYSESRDLAIDLETLPYQCPHCSTELLLGELRQHQETCAATKKKIDVEEIRKALAGQQVKSVLSEMQLRAREEAREGQNRSTFPCPFCSNAK